MDNEVRLFSTLAFKGAVERLAGQYQAAAGVRLDADFAPTVGLLKRLREGERADVVILTREGVEELVAERAVVAASQIDLARSWVGIAVKAGQPHPDIATEAARLGQFDCAAYYAREALMTGFTLGWLGATALFTARRLEPARNYKQ